jgi:hypothetical protein
MIDFIEYLKTLFSISGDASMKRWMSFLLIVSGVVFIFLYPKEPASATALIMPGCALLGVAAITKS